MSLGERTLDDYNVGGGEEPGTPVEVQQDGGCLAYYLDPAEGFRGWLAFEGQENPLAAGGFRVQRGLTAYKVRALARAMSLKQRLLGLAVDGAKCGIDYDPQSPGKREAMRRFVRFLRPFLLDRFSMGPDMGTVWSEIEDIARGEGIPSVKIAIAKAQGLTQEDVLNRLRLLDTTLGGLTLGQGRAGHGLAHAALAALGWLRPSTLGGRLRVGMQGFGTLGRAAALSLANAGLRVTAVADEHGCLIAPDGVDVGALLATPPATPVSSCGLAGSSGPREALFEVAVDLLVLAACEDAIKLEAAVQLPACVKVIAVGANLGLAPAVEERLDRRGIVILPDFMGGCGGSASMNALFGPPVCPSPVEFLDGTATAMRRLVHSILDTAAERGISPRAAALALCQERQPDACSKPYVGARSDERRIRENNTEPTAGHESTGR